MNRYQERLMDKPSLRSPYCVFCGRRKQSEHHLVPRSQGGTKGPTVSVCGLGNESGCHGLLHAHRLHVNWSDELEMWIFLHTQEPMKFHQALELDGWRPLRLRSIWE